MKRKIIEIDEKKCDGCGLCIPGCPEGALQIIEGKAKLVKDFYCDGLGACIGHCPQGAITVIEREAEEYDERAVMTNVIKQGDEVIQQHLDHLREHNEQELLGQAERILTESKEQKVELRMIEEIKAAGCPGSQNQTFSVKPAQSQTSEQIPSSLGHWPVQMHLISPMAPQYRDSDLLLAADCVPFALANFHQKYLTGKTLAIACPKLDQGQEIYLEKLKALIDQANVQSIAVMVMQVPCCSGMVQLAQTALQQAKRSVPLKVTVVDVHGEILNEVEMN